MSQALSGIAQHLIAANKKVQLIYAFNGVGKTRLSREFRRLIASSDGLEDEEESESREESRRRILYYNAFTEDLFFWDNDLNSDAEPKLKIQPNSFTNWILKDQGQDRNIIANFQRYTNDKLTPHFNEEYTYNGEGGKEATVKGFSEVTFSLDTGDDNRIRNLKISKGEESSFIWSVFYTIVRQVIDILNVSEPADRETDQFDELEYIFVDDPVSSLDENHLIESAVDLAQLIKSSKSEVKFVITTHNPLFYNVLFNELRQKSCNRYTLRRLDDGFYDLETQDNDSPFAYHLFLKTELENAISSGQIHKYHFNFLRNILEKTSTFLGHQNWGDLLKPIEGDRDAYQTRIINISSHSKHSGDEVVDLGDDDKRVLAFLVKKIGSIYRFQQGETND